MRNKGQTWEQVMKRHLENELRLLPNLIKGASKDKDKVLAKHYRAKLRLIKKLLEPSNWDYITIIPEQVYNDYFYGFIGNCTLAWNIEVENGKVYLNI